MCYTPLSPVRFLFKDIKNILSKNNDEFDKALNQLAEKQVSSKPTIVIVSNPNTGLQDLKAHWVIETSRIRINECTLCAIWAASYFTANAYVSLCDYLSGNTVSVPIYEDSINLLLYAKSLTPSFEKWPEDLPIPQDFESNPFVRIANMIMPIATDVVICHELSHMYLNHTQNGNLQQEFDADNLAVSWIIDNRREVYPIKELAVMTAFITMAILDLNADKDGNCHPSSFSRMSNYLENLNIDDNDILWAMAILTYRAWEKSFNQIPKIFPEVNKPFKEVFKSYL